MFCFSDRNKSHWSTKTTEGFDVSFTKKPKPTTFAGGCEHRVKLVPRFVIEHDSNDSPEVKNVTEKRLSLREKMTLNLSLLLPADAWTSWLIVCDTSSVRNKTTSSSVLSLSLDPFVKRLLLCLAGQSCPSKHSSTHSLEKQKKKKTPHVLGRLVVFCAFFLNSRITTTRH